MKPRGITLFLGLTVIFAGGVRAGPVYWITVDTAIHPIARQYILEGIHRAEADRAELLVLQLNTPGGLVNTMRTIVQDILAANIPIVGYVAPSGAHAASAGFYILIATDVAVMAPGTQTGASTPILGQGGEEKESKDRQTLRKKVENDLIALVKGITEKRGRNTDLAVRTITEALAFNETEALEKGIIELVAQDETDLLHRLDGRKVIRWDGSEVVLHTRSSVVHRFPMSFRYRLLSFIMDPNVIFILLSLGMLGLYVEITHPGLIFPGVLGVVFLIMALVSTQVLPINWGAVAMIAIAFLLFLLEIKITSYGFLTLGGLVLLTLGGLMLTDTPLNEWRVSRPFLVSLVVLVGLVVGLVIWLVVRTHRHLPTTGKEGLVEKTGWAQTDLNPGTEGWVFVDGSLWQAVTREPIAKGSQVRVRKIQEGMIVEVEPVRSSSSSETP